MMKKKTAKKNQMNLGQQRSIAWKQRQLKQQQRDKRLNYQKALSYQEVIICRCGRCGADNSLSIEKRTLPLIDETTIGWCQQCDGWRLLQFSPSEKLSDEDQGFPQPVEKALITACKATGLRYRFDGQYAILTGRTVRWYVDCISLHKNCFFCGKHRRIWGKNTDYELFYKLRKISAIDAILEIGAYDEVLDGSPTLMSMELRDSLRKRRIEKSCAVHGFILSFKDTAACIKTDLSEWRFDYHKERITLLHKNNGPVLDEISGAVMDYHVQYVNRDMAVEQVVEGIADHEKWRKEHSPSTQPPQPPIE